MSDLHVICPKCGYEGRSVHYFRMHTLEVIIASVMTLLLYFIFNLIADPRACPKCGNHRGLQPIFARDAPWRRRAVSLQPAAPPAPPPARL